MSSGMRIVFGFVVRSVFCFVLWVVVIFFVLFVCRV